MTRRRTVPPSLLTGLLAACLLALPARAQDRLPEPVRERLAALGVPDDAVGAAALPLFTFGPGRPFRHHAERPMQPGSAMKLVTAVVALDRLALAQAGRTRLRSSAPLEGGTLRGDLVLEGGADPDFGIAPLWQLLTELRDQGVQRIEGDLLLDRHRYRPPRLDVGLPPFDERPEGWWNVIPDALLFDGGLLPVELAAGADGPVAARTRPRIAGLTLDTAALQPVEGRCADWDAAWQTPLTEERSDGSVRVVLRGGFPRGCRRVEEMQVVERTRLLGLVFAQLWRELGGSFAGRVREAEAPAPTAARTLAERRARPWAEVLRPLMKTSDNTLARLLFLELGVPAMATNPGVDTIELARREVRRWFDERGIAAPGLVVDNGSGLSRSERIAPLTLARMVAHAWRGERAAELFSTLPLAGTDGTLRNRLKDSPATGVARLKTGTLRNVVALAGVVRDDAGRPWAVAVIVNDEVGSAARPVVDAFVDHLARFGPHGPERSPDTDR